MKQKAYVDTKFDSWTAQLVKKSGDRMSCNLNMQGNNIAGLAYPTGALHAEINNMLMQWIIGMSLDGVIRYLAS